MPGKSDTMRPMRWRAVIWLLWWCSVAVAGAASAAQLRVVATIYPVADLVQQIGQEAVEAVPLLPAGASPHTFEPSPEQIRNLAQAGLFVEVGAGLDSWADKLRAAHSGPLRVVTLTAGLPLLGSAHAHDGHAAAGGTTVGDPHVWLDPVLVRDHFVPVITAALAEADPAHQALFQQHAAEFQAALTELDGEIRAALRPLVNRSYISFHSAWRYFGQRYGLNEVAVIEAFPGKEPSAHEVAETVQHARAVHVRVMLVEPQFSPRMAEQIAHEIGARTAVVDPLGGPQLPGRDHYLALMRYNLHVFVQALQ